MTAKGGSETTQRATPVRVVTSRRVVRVDGPPDTRIATIAGAQQGRVARRQLFSAGLSRDHIHGRIHKGVLIMVHRGVYAYGHATDGPHSEDIAALLTRGPQALICSHRAAGLWKIRGMPSGVDVLVPGAEGGGRRKGIRIHRGYGPIERDFVDGVPVVTPARALLEIAADLSARDLERALDEAFSLGRVNRDDVAAELSAHPTWAGAGTLRRLLGVRLVGNPSRSHGQERLLALIRDAGLPDPEMDARVGGGYTVDCLWREAGVAVEYDSFQWHSSRSSWARDRRKDLHCRERGIELIRVTDEDFGNAPRLAVQLASSLNGDADRRSAWRAGAVYDA
ncbi:MAG: hypothetical protein J2O48_13725 [Solirubrobacterales bacterium]|nr:hypothetical protein [Solirubrobacterales bacterium]